MGGNDTMKTRDSQAQTSLREPAATQRQEPAPAGSAGVDVRHTPRMLAQRRAIDTAHGVPPNTPAQLTEMDAIGKANELSTVGTFSSWEQVHSHKDSFDEEAWRSIVASYNRNNSGVKLRFTPPRPKPEPVPEKAERSPTAQDRLMTAGSLAGTMGTVVSGAQAIHESDVGDFLQHVPVLGAMSSATTAITKSKRSDEAYRRGDLGEAALHQLGSLASGVKAASDTVSVGTGGLSAPVTVPLSALAGGINTVTSLPDYARTAKDVVSDPSRHVAKGLMSLSSVPEKATSIFDSVSSTFSDIHASLFGKEPTEEAPPLTVEQREAQDAERTKGKTPKRKEKTTAEKVKSGLIHLSKSATDKND